MAQPFAPLFDTLALSAWKEYGDSRWALRVNPSSGNLHPTEGYIICGAMPGLCETPMVAHYAPAEHALEVRAHLSTQAWRIAGGGRGAGRDGLPEETVFIGLTSILWREAWKYGERAYRYCQHDVGHALAALSITASGLGWEARLLDSLGSDDLAALLGVYDPTRRRAGASRLSGGLLPAGMAIPAWQAPESVLETFRRLPLNGAPNRLSREHVEWRWVAAAAEMTRKPASQAASDSGQVTGCAAVAPPELEDAPVLPLRRIIHQRRSAVAMDGVTALDAQAFYRILARTLPRSGAAPFALLPWAPKVDLALFVHRVRGSTPGLYLLAREPARQGALQAALAARVQLGAAGRLSGRIAALSAGAGDVRSIAQRLSCGQDIAADGCFSLGMIAEYAGPLQQHGAWFYPRLFWECGMIGQVLYLEAEAAGVRGTGIGCFFDDAVHELLGLHDQHFQSLYHFTIGGPLEDARLTTLPAYGGTD